MDKKRDYFDRPKRPPFGGKKELFLPLEKESVFGRENNVIFDNESLLALKIENFSDLFKKIKLTIL